MKKFVFLLALIIALSSCSEYNKILNKGDVKSQYKLAEKLFKEEEYSKAITLFEKVTPTFTKKAQLQRIQFMSAICYYKTKNYETASYKFNRFINNYPKSSKIEEAYFLNAQSLYELSPRSSIDQKHTTKALEALQTYLDVYPDSENTSKINNQYKELTDKLNYKGYHIAYLYYKTGKYKTAIVAFDNYLSDFIGTKYKEDALFYKFKSSYMLAIKSIDYKKLARLNNALKTRDRFLKYYPSSKKYHREVTSLLERINKEIEIINANTTAAN